MKKILSLTLVLVMALCMLTACTKVVIPVGSYADSAGYNVIEFGEYVDDEGTFKRYSTVSDEVVEGTYTLVAQDETSSWVEVTANDGTAYVYLYDSYLDLLQEYDEATSTLVEVQFRGARFVE